MVGGKFVLLKVRGPYVLLYDFDQFEDVGGSVRLDVGLCLILVGVLGKNLF